jgi:hypothetical protein
MAIRPKIIGPRPIERKVVRPATKPAGAGVTPPAKGPVPPVKPPVITPVTPVNTPVVPPVTSVNPPVVTPPVNTPVTPIVNTTTVNPPINRPVTPPVNTVVNPPVNSSVTPPPTVNTAKTSLNAPVKDKPQVNSPKAKVVKPKTESNVNSAVVMLSLLVVLLMGGVGYLMYDKLNHSGLASGDAKENVEVSKSEMDMEIAQINKLQDSIRVIIAQKEALGQELADERAKLGELEELKNQVRNSQLSINSLSRKLSRFKEEVHTAKASMATMEISNKELALEKENLQKLIQAKDDSLKSLTTAQSALSEKIALASSLKTQSVNVTVFNTAGKEISAAASYKAMIIRKVKVSFTFAENKVATHGPKDVYMRLIEPSGSTLFEGERIFMVNGRKTFYSDKQTVNFDNSQQAYDFVYTERSRYKPGKYAIELYTDGQKIGDASLTLVK